MKGTRKPPLTAQGMAELHHQSAQGHDALRGGLDELVQASASGTSKRCGVQVVCWDRCWGVVFLMDPCMEYVHFSRIPVIISKDGPETR